MTPEKRLSRLESSMKLVLSALLRMAIWGQSTGIPRHEWENKVKEELERFEVKVGKCRRCNTRLQLSGVGLCAQCQERFEAWVEEDSRR